MSLFLYVFSIYSFYGYVPLCLYVVMSVLCSYLFIYGCNLFLLCVMSSGL